MPNIINSFRYEHSFLSNFSSGPTIYDGLLYFCAEGAYQSAKSLDLMERMKFLNLTGMWAKKLGKTIELRPDWEKVKVKIMCSIVLDKFTRNPKLRELLLGTKDATIIEGNYWHDTFWGVCDGVGANHLGIILMDVRELLK